MKLSSLIASRPVLVFIILAIGVLLLPCVVVPCWYNMIKQMEKHMDLNAHIVQSGLVSEIENMAKLLHPINSSAINLARVVSSSINGRSILSSYVVEKKVAPSLFQAFSTIPFISQISYIGLGGLFFSYYYEGNQTFAVYSNSTASNLMNFSWYRQPVDSDTGKVYGDAVKSLPLITTNASWIEQALNSSQGHASFESGWSSAQDPLFLNTVSLHGQGVLSLGFSPKALTSFFNNVDLYGGNLYLATQSGKVLAGGLPNTQTVIKRNPVSLHMRRLNGDHFGNVSCDMPSNGKLKDSVLYLGEEMYRVYCSQAEIVGVQSVYALAFPYNGLASSVNRSVKISLILLIIMIAGIFISIVSFILLVVRTARREMHLCSALIKQMEATQQAERKSMNKSLAFASASHDIRAALAGITGLIEICRAEVRAGSELDTYLRQMDGCTKDLVGLLNSILDTSKIEAGKMQLEEEEFDLAKLLEDTVDLYHPVGMKKGVDVVLDPYDGSILRHSRVKGDRGKLKQILCNLLSNAVKFTSDGHVSVRAWTQKPNLENKIIASNQNGLWRLFSCLFLKKKTEFNEMKQKQNTMEFVFEVKDTGKGIPKDKQKSVFENFVQVKETALGQGGTGLGLGIVQSLVRLMGGEIGIVDIENGEKGTCFKFNVFLDICETPLKDNKNAEVEIEGGSMPDGEHYYPKLTIRTPSPGPMIRTPSPRLSILSSSPKIEGSHVVLLIQNEERLRSSHKYIEGLGIKVSSVKQWENLHSTLKRIKARQSVSPHSSSGKSDLGSRSDHFNPRSMKDVPLSSMDGIDQKPSASRGSNLRGAPGFVLLVIDAGAGPFQELCRVVADFRKDLHSSCCKVVWLDKPTSRSINLRSFEQDLIDPRDDILLKPFHGSRLYQVIQLLPEFRGHGLISISDRGSTIQDTGAVKDPGSSSSTHPQSTRLKIPSTWENSFQQVDSQADGNSTNEKYRMNPLLDDPYHSHARSKSREPPTERLPVRSSEIQEVRGNLSKYKSLSGLKFLVADDNEISRIVSRHFLTGHGATVEVCENGEEAFQLVRMGLHNQREHSHSIVLPYDYILMDCEMPKMDGCEATRQIRKEEKFYGVHIPILAFSADNSGDEVLDSDALPDFLSSLHDGCDAVSALGCLLLLPPFVGFQKQLIYLCRIPLYFSSLDCLTPLIYLVIDKYKMTRRCLHSNWLSSFKGPDTKFIPLNQRQGRGGKCSRVQVRIPGSSSLPFSHSYCCSHDCRVSHSHNQIPYVWPYSSATRTLLQEKLSLILNSTASSKPKTSLPPSFTLQGKVSGLSIRWFSCSSNDDADSDAENEENDESDNCESENKGASVKSTADPEELHKVCKVIDELFALDHNMEAVLDECGINLSHDLVIEVLERFRHARKPAFRFFCWAAEKPGFVHDSRTYHSMMIILAKARQFETMMSMLEEMGEKRLLTLETFSIAMRAFAAAKERKKAVGIFELMKNHKYKVGVETINALLDSLGRAKLGKEAQALFGKLEGRFTPDLRTYTVLLNGWCRVKNLMEAGRIWNEMLDRGFKPDIVTHNIMLEGLLRSHRRSDAIKFFEVMKAKGPSPDVRSYTILIRDLCKQTKMKEAVGYFYEMVDSGCHPDAAVYTCLMTGYGNHKRMDMVYELLKEMKEKGCPPDGKTYNALIKLMTSQRMPDDAVRIYKKMIQNGIEPSIHSYNMIMKSYFRVRNFEMGHAVWDEMSKKGFCPDDNSYTVFIGGLISQNRSEEACKYLEEMIEKGMKAPQLDYNKFAADFSRAGKPDILEELAQKMKFSGKFEVSNVFARWAEMMKKRVKRREPSDRKCNQLVHDQRYSF